MTIRRKVLIVENDREYREELFSLLSENGYEVLVAQTGEETLCMVSSHCPELVLMNPVLPDKDGLTVLNKIRVWTLTPVIMISQIKKEAELVQALDSGADDYVSRQSLEELLARMRMAIRHTRTGSDDVTFAREGKRVIGGLIIDYNKFRVYVDGQDVGLTQNEFRMVALLGRYAGDILPYRQIMKELWGPNAGFDNQILRVNMTNIRKKIEKNPNKPKYIRTEKSIGYRMINKEEAIKLTEKEDSEKVFLETLLYSEEEKSEEEIIEVLQQFLERGGLEWLRQVIEDYVRKKILETAIQTTIEDAISYGIEKECIFAKVYQKYGVVREEAERIYTFCIEMIG